MKTNVAGGAGVWAATDTYKITLGASATGSNNKGITRVQIAQTGQFETGDLNITASSNIYSTATTSGNKLDIYEPGDSIKVRLTVKHKTERSIEYGEVRWHVTLTNQNDEQVAEYELLTMNSQ